MKVRFRSILPAGAVPTFVSGDRLEATVGRLVYFIVQVTGSPTLSLQVIGGLPGGFSFGDYGNGYALLGGVPTTADVTPVTVRATNARGTTDQIITVTVVNPSGSSIWNIPSSIDKTGTTDVTGPLQAFLDSVPDGTPGSWSIVRFPTGSHYRIDSTLVLQDRAWIALDAAAGGKLRAGTPGPGDGGFGDLTRSQLRLNRVDHAVIYGLEIEGANPFPGWNVAGSYDASRETQHAIEVRGSNGVEIAHCLLHHTYGDGIYMGRDLGPTPHVLCDGVWAHHNEIHSIGRQGISGCGIASGIAESNNLHDLRRSAFDWEPIGSDPTVFGVFGFWCLNNQIGAHYLTTFASKGTGLVEDLIIAGNTAADIPGGEMTVWFGSSNLNDGSPGPRRTRHWLIDNAFPRLGALPVSMQRIDRAYIGGNTRPTQNRLWNRYAVPGDPGYGVKMPMVEARHVTDTVSAGNTISPSPGPQLLVNGGTNTITDPLPVTPPAPPDVAGRGTGGYVPV